MSFLTQVVDGIVLTTLFALRRRFPDRPRPFTVPWYPVLPAAVLVLYAALIVLIAVTQPDLALGGAGLLAAVAAAAWLGTSRRKA